MKEKFYVTTPIYYPSRKLTLGNSYTTIICDAIARFNKKFGKDVFYLTGTDEHGQKISQAAANAGKKEMDYLDEIIADTKNLWNLLGIEYDKFIRTTDDYHEKTAQKVFNELYKRGYIYKGAYKGWYCTPCESFFTESQLVDGKCPDCGREVKFQEEEAYFFKLSEFGDRLIKLYEENPEFLQPQSRVNEMINNFIKPGLNDLCVSRTSVKWGVPVEFDPNHTIYVWIDALSNYISALGAFSDNDENFKKFWPADVHVVGKEIVRFHAIIWPAILMALDLPLPKRVYAHGWILFGGDKLSKSKETGEKECVDPRVLVPLYGSDAIRYFLYREIPFGGDGNYSTALFLNKFNSDLSNNFGNLVSRTFGMMRKYFASVVPAAEEITADDEEFKNNVLAEVKAAYEYMDKIEITKAITAVFNIFTHANTYIQKVEPWAVAKAENGQARLKTIMRYLLESIRIGTSLFEPFAPDCTAKVLTALGLETRGVFENMEDFDGLAQGKELGALDILFPRLDVEAETEKLRKIANPEE
ncbi:MAG: methionine--tRNA ligase [Clostridia bacterium]|nr:methionine--tRNA ligase [Clostridia bacterium]